MATTSLASAETRRQKRPAHVLNCFSCSITHVQRPCEVCLPVGKVSPREPSQQRVHRDNVVPETTTRTCVVEGDDECGIEGDTRLNKGSFQKTRATRRVGKINQHREQGQNKRFRFRQIVRKKSCPSRCCDWCNSGIIFPTRLDSTNSKGCYILPDIPRPLCKRASHRPRSPSPLFTTNVSASNTKPLPPPPTTAFPINAEITSHCTAVDGRLNADAFACARTKKMGVWWERTPRQQEAAACEGERTVQKGSNPNLAALDQKNH